MLSLAWPGDRALIDGWLRGLSLGSQAVETFALLDQLNRRICSDFRYQAREEPGVQSPALTRRGARVVALDSDFRGAPAAARPSGRARREAPGATPGGPRLSGLRPLMLGPAYRPQNLLGQFAAGSGASWWPSTSPPTRRRYQRTHEQTRVISGER